MKKAELETKQVELEREVRRLTNKVTKLTKAAKKKEETEKEEWKIPALAASKDERGIILPQDIAKGRKVHLLTGDVQHDPDWWSLIFYDRNAILGYSQTMHMHPDIHMRLASVQALLGAAKDIVTHTDPFTTIPYPHGTALIALHADLSRAEFNAGQAVRGLANLEFPLRQGDGEPLDPSD